MSNLLQNYTLEDFVKCRNQKEWVCDNCMKCGDRDCCSGNHIMFRVPKTDDCLCSVCVIELMTNLSPAAQAIEYAYFNADDYRSGLAAALRAAADQVAPWQPEPTEESLGPTIDFGYAWALFSKTNDVRQELLAIAAELEGE